jgi:hypothetical protein
MKGGIETAALEFQWENRKGQRQVCKAGKVFDFGLELYGCYRKIVWYTIYIVY